MSVQPPRNYATFDDSATVGTAMNRAGYNTLFLGKYLNGYGNESLAGDEEELVPLRARRAGRTGTARSQRTVEQRTCTGGTYQYYHQLLNHNGRIEDRHKGTYQTVAQGRLARRLVTEYHRSAKPFFLYYAPIAPHVGAPREKGDPASRRSGRAPARRSSFKTPARPKRVRGGFDREITRAPGLPADGSESQKDVNGLPRPMRWLPPIVPEEEAAMLSMTRQRAEALFVLDQQIGQARRDARRKTGEYDNTVLMFTSDNGFFIGEHRMRQGKIWTHEPSLRVPFVASQAPECPRGTRFDPISTRGHRGRPSSTSAARTRRGLPTVSRWFPRSPATGGGGSPSWSRTRSRALS